MAKAAAKYDEDVATEEAAPKAKAKGGGHPKPSSMRQDVAGKPLEDLSADIDSARTPYPTGSPRDPADIFEEQNGYRKAE